MNSNGTRYAIADNLGSPRVVTNSGGGGVVSRHDYMPFGEELFAGTGGRTVGMGFSVADGNRQKFTGYERDNETGLDFAQARYHSSNLGRFTSPDPFGGSMRAGDPQSFNRYAYVRNNPVNRTDPTGLFDASDEVRSTRWAMSQSFGVEGERRNTNEFEGFADPRELPEPQEEVTSTVAAEVIVPLAEVVVPQNPNPNCITNTVAGGTLAGCGKTSVWD